MAQNLKITKYEDGDIREYLGRRLSRFINERSEHEPNWKELKKFVLPRAGHFDDSDGNLNRIPNYDDILNSTATNAVKVFTAFIMAGMSSPARPWFKLTNEDIGRISTPEEATWLEDFRDLMLDVFARSNFYHVLPRVYEEGAVFGNGLMYIAEDMEDIVRFYHYTIGEFYWGLSDRLEIDTVYRPFTMKVSQVVKKFGLEKCSQRVREDYANKRLDEDVRVVHAIEPNVPSLPKQLRPLDRRKKFISVYYEQGNKEKMNKVLSLSGFRQFPGMPFRLHPRSDDPYGIGVGAEALGDIRELQGYQMALATGLDYMNEPHLKSSGALGQVFRHPGAITKVNPRHADSLEPVHEVRFPVGDMRAEIEALERRIREWFDNHLARHVLNEDRSNVTAREIEAAEQEKLLLAGPVLESVQIFLSKVIDRTFEIMVDAGVGPPIPESLQGSSLNVEFLGVLAQAQKAVGVRTLERVWEFGTAIATSKQDLTVLDKLDAEESIDIYAKLVGAPVEMVRDDDTVAGMRQERQAAQQQAEQLAQAEMMANTGKTMAETPTGGQTALSNALDVVGAPF